jgi:hypothetical protein
MAVLSRVREWALQDGPIDWLGGLRLACAFLLPVAVGVLVDQKMTGLFVGVGAFMVANSDLGESYTQRLRLMMPATLAIVAMTALGMAAGTNKWLTVPLGALVIFTGAVIAAVGREAALFGTFFSFAYVIGVGIAGTTLSIAQVSLALLGGGAFAMLLSAIHVVVRAPRPDLEPEPWSTVPTRLRSGLTEPASRRHAIGMAAAGAIGLAVVPFTHQSNGAWLVTGSLMVMKPAYGATVRFAGIRAAATVLGAAAAGSIAAATSQPWVLLALALLLTWCAEAVVARSFAIFVLLITPLSILLTNVLVPGDWTVAFLRVADVAAGSLLAVVIATVIYWWSRARP